VFRLDRLLDHSVMKALIHGNLMIRLDVKYLYLGKKLLTKTTEQKSDANKILFRLIETEANEISPFPPVGNRHE
jgi:hypothetical protein